CELAQHQRVCGAFLAVGAELLPLPRDGHPLTRLDGEAPGVDVVVTAHPPLLPIRMWISNTTMVSARDTRRLPGGQFGQVAEERQGQENDQHGVEKAHVHLAKMARPMA